MGWHLKIPNIFRYPPISWRIPFCRDLNGAENERVFKMPAYLIGECFLQQHQSLSQKDVRALYTFQFLNYGCPKVAFWCPTLFKNNQVPCREHGRRSPKPFFWRMMSLFWQWIQEDSVCPQPCVMLVGKEAGDGGRRAPWAGNTAVTLEGCCGIELAGAGKP